MLCSVRVHTCAHGVSKRDRAPQNRVRTKEKCQSAGTDNSDSTNFRNTATRFDVFNSRA